MHARYLSLCLLLLPLLAQASLRCGQNLVEEGDSVDQVLAACGAPAERQVNPPALRNNGVPKFNAAETQFWTYGPANGASRRLKFIDGKLVEIRLVR
ncbi:DUF2845 domain-containing protein [Pseudomonas sp. EpS/L25]|uniref:DUF2845 domain-containing protein n=1 Tax=Pseudomonas sp. EpS/L25 TaxID=1749078 RepID=UPI0007445040|nr:DUF2845 domain-containing protein [Pseudomonas sp. EpS/L25]KUM40047.1 hypothetical protein AR540_12150 [Pseudomonas sp. EpS/L25]